MRSLRCRRFVSQGGGRPIRLYDLRHMWATRAAMSGIDLVILAAMLGYSKINTVMRYAHPTQDHQTTAIAMLERYNALEQIRAFERREMRPNAESAGSPPHATKRARCGLANLLIYWRRGSGSNRRIKVLQTSPLPLGYRASRWATRLQPVEL